VRYPTVESVTVEPDGWLNLKYAPHISLGRLGQAEHAVGPLDAAEYEAWDGSPWRDPNEVDAMHAEAIENALNDDIDPGE
jgi:hypothetical protein